MFLFSVWSTLLLPGMDDPLGAVPPSEPPPDALLLGPVAQPPPLAPVPHQSGLCSVGTVLYL